ncbi:unnamed protein product [Plutella xylostella]|uniref:non-specific serine/threonine protein kinase n=1 Tax=Plutella xylostella TaxID=51655 RepID=A0A8S4GDR3_PLUXY|nr:unnamed protein product [Plutella xylostella]
MKIYELPYDINKELCRLLDIDDDWKKLAGDHMQYYPFDIIDIEQEARRQVTSPTNQLFIRWGQLNHSVEELFVLLHRMKYVTAMKLLLPVVDARFHKLLRKHSSSVSREKDTAAVDENANKAKMQRPLGSESSIPLPVMLIEKGEQMPTSSSRVINANTRTDDSSTDNTSSTVDLKATAMHDEFIKNVSAIPMLSYEDLQEATNNWSEANLLGRGGFGQVYKGEWKLLPIAVKRLRDNDGKNRELIREMCLNQYRHDNILPLYGYSLGGQEACLVYQLMLGGSLEQRLRRKTHHPPLSWSQRYNILLGVARGLTYLHTMAGTPLIHGDIKPANILLDQCTMPKIGDFGLARKGPYGEERSHLKVSRVHGTRYYLPAEYLTARCLSPAVDAYSFGVLSLEAVSARGACSRTASPALLVDQARVEPPENLEDPILRATNDSNPQLCAAMVAIGIACTEPARRQRPSMLTVYRQIEALHSLVINNNMANQVA